MDNKTLNDYGRLILTNTMSDLVQLFNTNSDNSKLVDALLSYTIDTGVFRTGSEKISEMSIGPHNNLQFPLSSIKELLFTGFVFYFKSLHKVVTEVPRLDISGYKDSKLHLLYLKPDKTFEVLDTKYIGTEDYLYVGRFIITDSEVVQFYVMTRNAGTNPFDKNGVSYEVIKGLIPEVKSELSLTSSDGVIKYSGINILSETDTDILEESFEKEIIPIRYVELTNKVDWTKATTNNVVTNKIISDGALSTVTAGKFVCQKVFYDYPTKSFVVQYGHVIYDSYNEALAGASNFNYDEPDYEGAYIPVAVLVIKAGATDLSVDGAFKVISITDKSTLSAATAVDPTAQALANSALQQAQAAQSTADSGVSKADAAQSTADNAVASAANAQSSADTANTKIDTHLTDTNNPHNVSKEQIGLGNVDNTADSLKPLSTPQKSYVDEQITEVNNIVATKADNSTQTKVVVKSSQPTKADYGRDLIKGDIWIIP